MTYKNERGATLVEVMVSVFIFAIGVLGFASLQTRSAQGGFDNGQRDQVIWLSKSLVDRIKANPVGIPDGNGYAALLSDFTIDDCSVPATICAQTSAAAPPACSTDEVVEYDVWDLVCSNDYQGANVIRDLEIDLDCDGACAIAGVNMNLTLSWCSKLNESVLVDSGANETCDPLSQMSYSVDYVP